MFKIYEKYLEAIDEYLSKCFKSQGVFIHCKSGCSMCCEVGEYPFSRLEMEYLMNGFPELAVDVQILIRNKIKELKARKKDFSGRFMHECPFLIEKKCVLYSRRGVVCRTFGLASFEQIDGRPVIKLPECSRHGLNYSEILDNSKLGIEAFQKYGVSGPIPHSLNLNYFEKEIIQGVKGLEFGEIRSMLDWF